jgi:hypothetical protein
MASGYNVSITMQYAAPLPHCSTLVYLCSHEKIECRASEWDALQPCEIIEPLQAITAPDKVSSLIQANSAHGCCPSLFKLIPAVFIDQESAADALALPCRQCQKRRRAGRGDDGVNGLFELVGWTDAVAPTAKCHNLSVCSVWGQESQLLARLIFKTNTGSTYGEVGKSPESG